MEQRAGKLRTLAGVLLVVLTFGTYITAGTRIRPNFEEIYNSKYNPQKYRERLKEVPVQSTSVTLHRKYGSTTSNDSRQAYANSESRELPNSRAQRNNLFVRLKRETLRKKLARRCIYCKSRSLQKKINAIRKLREYRKKSLRKQRSTIFKRRTKKRIPRIKCTAALRRKVFRLKGSLSKYYKLHRKLCMGRRDRYRGRERPRPRPQKTTIAVAANETCGSRQVVPDLRIAGGTLSLPGEFPWQVRIVIDNGLEEYICGGSIIAEQWILTAAHCLLGENLKIVIHAGDYDVHVTEVGSTIAGTNETYSHPEYDMNTSHSDLALIKLNDTLKFSPLIQKLCLAQHDSVLRTGVGTVTGWGTTSYNGKALTKMNKVHIKIISNRRCRSMYQGLYRITNKMLCGYSENKDACQGDSGGPYIVRNQFGAYVQVGVVSFGNECAKLNNPGVYTRISRFTDWIQKVARADICFC